MELKAKDIIRFIQAFGLEASDVSMNYDDEGNLTDFFVYLEDDSEEDTIIDEIIRPGRVTNN